MSERTLRIIIGLLILVALYFELPELIAGLIVFMLFEAITNWRLPILISKLRHKGQFKHSEYPGGEQQCKFSFEAERAMRLSASFFLCVTYFVLNEYLWFIPWFMGITILGAGVSGVCPMVITFKALGFR